jgi:hypothetical protein
MVNDLVRVPDFLREAFSREGRIREFEETLQGLDCFFLVEGVSRPQIAGRCFLS